MGVVDQDQEVLRQAPGFCARSTAELMSFWSGTVVQLTV